MVMNRDALLAKLAELAGPLGPLVSVSERRDAQDRWADEGGLALLDTLTDLLLERPLAEVVPAADVDDVEILVVEILARISGRDPDRARSQLQRLLRVPSARGVAIDVLGASGGMPAVGLLASLRRETTLDAATQLRLAGALGEIGGDEACAELRALASTAATDDTELLQEIKIAQQRAGCPERRP
jgi:hypothetical protein